MFVALNEKKMNPDYYSMHMMENKYCMCVQECRCGEKNVHEWTWDAAFATTRSELSRGNLEVKFHPGYSSGTAAARGNKPLDKGRHHFWEIKMITPVYGTDVMVGVGTNKVDFDGTRETFCSLLGSDKESWGFSYRGYLQHAGETRSYASIFEQGSLVGVHLDMWMGTLQYFLNRKPLGIAFTGLKGIDLYPMVCSTAAQSKMRITYSCSVPATLQTDCLALLRPSQRAYLSVAFPGLRYLTESIFAEMLQRDIDDEDGEDSELNKDWMIFDDYDFALVGLNKRKRRKCIDENNGILVLPR